MTRNLAAWLHDDICWCDDATCERTDCMRNTKNMMDPSGPHSYSHFRGCEICPITREEREGEKET